MSRTRGPRLGRRITATTVVVLAAVSLVVLGPVPAAVATDCAANAQSEVHAGLPGFETGCDDVSPPETSLSSPVNDGGSVSSKTLTFTFSGAYTDAEAAAVPAHPIGFDCQLYNTASAPLEWTECNSGTLTTPALEESDTVPYTFRVRAVDLEDDEIVACDENGLDGCLGEEAIPDEDQSPATVTFKVDTLAPNTFLTRGPVDSIRPDWPVTTSASPQFALNSNEASSYACSLNGKAVACAEGSVTLRNLSGGSKNFQVAAVDAAGNVDPTPAGARFFVPANIKKSKGSGWDRVRAKGYFGRDYLEADKVGATLRIRGQRNVREVRLLAPAGPRLGVLEVRVGKSEWYTVDLRSNSKLRQKVYLVRSHFTPRQKGTIQIRVKKLRPGRTVAVDALVARN